MHHISMAGGEGPPRPRNHGVAEKDARRRHPNAMIAFNSPSLLMRVEANELNMDRAGGPTLAALFEFSSPKGNVVAANHQDNNAATLSMETSNMPFASWTKQHERLMSHFSNQNHLLKYWLRTQRMFLLMCSMRVRWGPTRKVILPSGNELSPQVLRKSARMVDGGISSLGCSCV